MTFSSIKKDIDAGVGKIRWFAALLSERLRIELMVFRLLYRSEELRKQRDELLLRVGEKVYDMRAGSANIRTDSEVESSLKEIEALEGMIKENIEKASEISKVVS